MFLSATSSIFLDGSPRFSRRTVCVTSKSNELEVRYIESGKSACDWFMIYSNQNSDFDHSTGEIDLMEYENRN